MTTIHVAVSNQMCIFDVRDYIKYLDCGYTIHVQPSGYRIVRFSGGSLRNKHFARVIMDCGSDQEVDHIDGNTLNNSKCNLRLVTRAQNNTNRTAYNKSGSKGVWKNGNSWVAQIRVDGKLQYLGSWPIKSFAEKAFEEAAAKHQGEFAAHLSRNSK